MAFVSSALATPYDTLSSIAGTYNLFLTGNLGTASAPYSSTDAQGPIAVAGNAYLSSFSADANRTSTTAAVIGGNLVDQNGSLNGNVFVGGATTLSGVNVSGYISLTNSSASLTASNMSAPSGGVYITSSANALSVPSYWSAATVGAKSAPLDVFGSSTDIQNASTSLAALSATTITSSGGNITITLTQNGLNVIDLSVLNGATINSITIVNAAGVTPTGLVVNVSGTNLTLTNGSMSLGTLSSSAVLFNFSNATTLSLSGYEFDGTLLAPLASVSFNNGDINGALIANNLTGNGELHEVGFTLALPTYATTTTATAGEPASLAVYASGLMLIMWVRRQRMNGALAFENAAKC